MNTRILLAGLAVALPALLASSGPAVAKKNRAPERPNILLISVDTLRADRLGSHGYERETSPFLDEFAARGTQFLNAFVASNSTDSSHATILTSHYPETHGISMVNNMEMQERINMLPESIPLLPQILQQQGYNTLAVTGSGWVTQEIGFGRGFDVFDESLKDFGEQSARLVQLFRDRKNKQKPTFAFLHTYEVHSPYWPPEEYRGLFGDFSDRRMMKNSFLRRVCSEPEKHLDAEDWRYMNAMYDAGIRYADDVMRKLMADLESVGFMEHGVVLFTSDHGEGFGEHGVCLHGGRLYDVVQHVPLILVGSGIPAGKKIDRLVGSVDIMPTILNLAHSEIEVPLGGRDLLAKRRRHNPATEVVFGQIGPYEYVVRTREWKLYTALDPGTPDELYDLRVDPGEQNNVISEHPDEVKRMYAMLDGWKARVRRLAETTTETTLSEEQLEKLRSLGYVD